MALPEQARERLQDVRELEPTSNGELRDRWDMDSGREVASYLRDELGEYTYRDDNSKIRVDDDAPNVETEGDGDTSETGATLHESGGEVQADPSPSEPNEGLDEQAQQADDTPSGETLDLQPPERTGACGGTGNAATDTENSGGQRMELPDDGGPTVDITPVDGCPECRSGRFGYVRDERETLRARGIEPDALPGEARICLDCWLAADSARGTTIYTVDGETTDTRTADAPQQGELKPANGGAGGTRDTKPSCPACGDVLLKGYELTAMLNDAARRDKTARRFLKANEGIDPDLACRNVYDCGYYAENCEARTFNSPKGGWGRKLLAAGGVAAAAGVAGLAASQQASNDEWGPGAGGDRILD